MDNDATSPDATPGPVNAIEPTQLRRELLTLLLTMTSQPMADAIANAKMAEDYILTGKAG